MNYIRQAVVDDLGRIAEIFVFNYRLNFFKKILSILRS